MQVVENRAPSLSFTGQCYHSLHSCMLRSRLPAAPRQSRRTPPDLPPALAPSPDPAFSPRDLLLRSWAGRTFLAASALKVLVAIVRRIAPVPQIVEVISSAATIALVISVGYFVWRLFAMMKRRLLWRVRRKLILSYIFIGVVPALLIIAFFTLGAWVVSTNVSAYLFRDGYDDIVEFARQAASAAASEIGRNPAATQETIARVHRFARTKYKALSIEFVPRGPGAPAAARVGEWAHLPPPSRVPPWITAGREGFTGTIAQTLPERGADVDLVIRSVQPVEGRAIGYVIVDVPFDGEVRSKLYDTTGVKAGVVRLGGDPTGALPQVTVADPTEGGTSTFALFGRGITILDAHDWDRGQPHRATIANSYTIRELYEKLSGAQSAQMGTGAAAVTLGQAILIILVVVAVLFLIIEFVALIMGLALARSITSSIHELFMGTERVRHGDFTHRITIMSNDQLGELAGSFNQMIGSIENLLQTAAEKKRLEEELRIARQIQMSLLPRGPLDMPGLAVTALCVPAREVGGDYYDFFPLAPDRLGVLIADVSGKGTSAALYMAELKGLVLSLSQIYQSPRQLLLEVNRIISENLDSRSFITMTYAVLDLAAATMTYARAGHTPLIHLRSQETAGSRVQVLVPNGMVLGLRIPGAEEKFAELLEEDRIELATDDVIVLYTDGITEAMNADSDLFGDSRLSLIVEEHGHLDSGELRERILREIEAFVGAAHQHDDMTMILMKIERVIPARATAEHALGQATAS
jgi:sigma-B regulation protein RsbU (phosphoserine phosphatase)